MAYDVWCSIDGCSFEETDISNIDEVYDIQDEHGKAYGEHHLLEFDRIESEMAADDDDD